MKSKKVYLLLLASMTVISGYAVASVSPSDLVKVTNGSDVKCVEYYSYKGDMYCSLRSLSSGKIDPEIRHYEKRKIQFDTRAWQPVWGKKSDDGMTVEYVPLGDDINNWYELVTSQFFAGLQDTVTPKKFADTVIKDMQDQGYNPVIHFIETSPDQVVFEFQMMEPANQIQDEIQIITKGKDGIYALHYVIKVKDMGKKNRDLWVNNLLKSKLMNNE